jgi:hypothetical protein
LIKFECRFTHEYPESFAFRDGRKGGLNKENRIAAQLFFYAFILHSNLRLDSVYGIKKPEPNDSGFPCREEYRIIEPDLGGVGGD